VGGLVSRLWLVRAAILVCVMLVVGGSAALAAEIVAQGRDAGPRVEMRALGKVVVTNSRKGKAVLRATGLAPGKQVSGTLRIGNKSRNTVTLRLKRGTIKRVAGPYGGNLGALLRLKIVDVTKKKRPKVIYNGMLLTMKQRKLILKPRKARSFRFIVIFPAATRGVDQNLVMGSTLIVKYIWTATPRR
jgi:hypothetical protein